MNSEKASKIKSLENEAKASADKIQKMKSDEEKKLQEKDRASESEISQWKARVTDLEQRLYPAGRTIYVQH